MPRRQPSKQSISQKATSEDAKCLFCAKGPDHDNSAVGPIYSKDGVFAHKNCLYFGAGLIQKEDVVDTDSEGADELFFFQIEAIHKEARRSSKLKCNFCKLPNASAGCLNKKCKKKFHFPCGMENGVMFNFRDFTSSCCEHQERQEPHGVTVDLICHICQDDVEDVPSFNQIYCPVCKRWLHRRCVQTWAYKAGVHHLRCPMCNNDEQFKEELFRLGFELPDRDAEWEREGMYREQEAGVFMRCSAEDCICPKGRDYSAKKGVQELIACITCGEYAVHRQCIDNYSHTLVNGAVDVWECEICERVTLKLEAQRQLEEHYKERVEARKAGKNVPELPPLEEEPQDARTQALNDQVGHASVSESEMELEMFIHMEARNADMEEAPVSKKARTSIETKPVSPKKQLETVLKSPPGQTASSSKPSSTSKSAVKSNSGKKQPKRSKESLLSPRNPPKQPPQRSMSTSKNPPSSSEGSSSSFLASPTYAARVIPAFNSEKPFFPLFQSRRSTSASKPDCENPSVPEKNKLAPGQLTRMPGDSSNRLSPPLLLPIPVAVQSLLLD